MNVLEYDQNPVIFDNFRHRRMFPESMQRELHPEWTRSWIYM